MPAKAEASPAERSWANAAPSAASTVSFQMFHAAPWPCHCCRVLRNSSKAGALHILPMPLLTRALAVPRTGRARTAITLMLRRAGMPSCSGQSRHVCAPAAGCVRLAWQALSLATSGERCFWRARQHSFSKAVPDVPNSFAVHTFDPCDATSCVACRVPPAHAPVPCLEGAAGVCV